MDPNLSGAAEPAALEHVLKAVRAATAPDQARRSPESDRAESDALLLGLRALSQLKASLDAWEPALVAAARARGVSWAKLAPVLGVASRQAAERRYLRSRQAGPHESGTTRDERVLAERDRRAADRAVTHWALGHGADLRQLAGQVSALTDLEPAAQASLARLLAGLADDDAAALLPLLADTHQHLRGQHAGLAERLDSVARATAQVRQDVQRRRSRQRETHSRSHKRQK